MTAQAGLVAVLFLVWCGVFAGSIDRGVSRFKAQQRRCRGSR